MLGEKAIWNSGDSSRKALISVFMVGIMLFSTQMYSFQDFETYDEKHNEKHTSSLTEPSDSGTYQQGGQAEWPQSDASQGPQSPIDSFNHPAFNDPSYHDPLSYYGKVADPSALIRQPGYSFFLEETDAEDHDNDGIGDLSDLDDDNDGINDLIEMFDGCYGTHPYDHDNDGILDEFDWDDDNDGILEGPIDYDQGADPRNVSMDRYVEPTTVHPWTGTPVGVGYRVDQNPLDHDNDGVTDDDNDGSGPDSYDEDDDNDGRIDQFVWPCDFDSDGVQDYFDADDDSDGVEDLWDSHPWDSTITTNITTTSSLWDTASEWGATELISVSIGESGLNPDRITIEEGDTVTWTNDDSQPHNVTANDGTFDSGEISPGGTFTFTFSTQGSWVYSDPSNSDPNYEGRVTAGPETSQTLPDAFNLNEDIYGTDKFNFVTKERTIWHPRAQAFTQVVDGDLDGDGIPNFVDPDNDNDGTPDSADNDDDNDGLLDMWDVDDDNDGIPDSCMQVDTNSDGNGDLPNSQPIGVPGIDCELDYDRDLDDDIYRPIDSDYDLVWDWKDTDVGGAFPADNLLGNPGNDPNDLPYDLDNDGIVNELDPFMNATEDDVLSWDCPSIDNPNPVNPDPRCTTERKSYTGNNDWDGDGFNNWEDVDDDNDGVLDWLDIDPNCDLDDDADLHNLNGSMFRDDGANDIDTDIDGDGLSNDLDWDDDNDGISDLYDPDDGNCGVVDSDSTDQFDNSYSHQDGELIDGSDDGTTYTMLQPLRWDQFWHFSPFFADDHHFILPYNGYQESVDPVTGLSTMDSNGVVPEMYWHVMMKWSPWNGNNFFDIDMDGDSLINGIDVDMDADGMPDWWDQDEGSDGRLDVNDPAFGGSLNDGECDLSLFYMFFQIAFQPIACGVELAWLFGWPVLRATQVQGTIYTNPYSTRPDPQWDQGSYNGSNSNGQWTCNKNCFWFDFNGNQDVGPSSAVSYVDIMDNRDLWIAFVGVNRGLFQWGADSNANMFPDEVADLLNNDVDPDDDCGAPVAGNMEPQCMFNDTADLDDDFDGIYDHWDIDDDNDGIWDYMEVDSNDDLDDDSNTEPPGSFFTGTNCEDNDDDGTDTDPDDDGWYQAVWDKGLLGQGLLAPKYYDVDNDNDGVPDGEDPDDDNNGVPDSIQETLEGCFTGEEQSPWDHDNDGTPNWADNDWDGDGLVNVIEQSGATPFITPWDHDNDGIRDDIDDDDDADGMKDEDEVMLWPTRFGSESTNPWDHDDFGNGSGIANPTDPSTGPDAIDNDDDADNRTDVDWDHLEENWNGSSDWDQDNDGIPDEDDKIPTRITLFTEPVLWLDAFFPAKFNGSVDWLDPDQGVFTRAPNIPVQVIIEWANNGTIALETIDVLTDEFGEFEVGQYLFPEDLEVGPSTTYNIFAEVTEMFVHDGASTEPIPVEVRANTTVDYVAWTYFRSDEQPLFVDFKVHYSADWDRGIFDNRLPYAPVSFNVSGGPFGNTSNPTVFDGYGYGYRADSGGWVSLTFVQSSGSQGIWKQVQWNSTMDNGPGAIPGGYEEIVWDDFSKSHNVIGRYNYTSTSLPIGDYTFTAYSRPDLGSESPWPYLEGDESDSFNIRSMHRMYVEADIITPSIRPVYFWDATQFTGSSFGAWRALFHSPSLVNANIDYQDASLGKPYPILWDGNPQSLAGEASRLRPFLSSNGTHWFIAMQNGGDFNVPPCGPVDPLDPDSDVRCEIVPEMFTGETLRVVGSVWNRTMVPWPHDPMALQVDVDGNGVFAGSTETGFARVPSMVDGVAQFDYNWTWYSQYSAGVFGIRADFTNSNFYFTGNQTSVLAPTGAYVNVSVIGTTDFQFSSIPRLYRGQNVTLEARLIDNAFQPVRDAPVNYTWSADNSAGVAITDNNGVLKINLTIDEFHELGNFTLGVTYPGDPFRQGSSAMTSLWVVSRTYLSIQSTTPNLLQAGDIWEFSGQVTDDNRTAVEKDLGEALDGCLENGGEVLLIMEGTDFEDRTHRQIIETLCPNAGSIYHQLLLNPQLLKDDPNSFLPDGFGPVNVILRFQENLPHEGCGPLEADALSTSGAWDPCALIVNSDHYRKVMQFQVDGFSLIGRTQLSVDDQIVYTSEIDPNTGQAIEKPMIVTGQLTDELGSNLSNRAIRITYEMIDSSLGVISCLPGTTDADGFFEIVCPLSGVTAGQARVNIQFNSYENNDRYRYSNSSSTRIFPVFSNSTMQIMEVGPFRSDVDTYTFQNGSEFPVVYLKESFHVEALLTQVNGNPIGGKCLNLYINPETNTRPIGTMITEDGTGTVKWFSGDPEDNPSRRGIEPDGESLEGFRTLRVAYEPDRELPGGCRAETTPVVNSSFMDIEVLVRSRVDILLKEQWADPIGYKPGDDITGSVAILRDRLDVAVAGETVIFKIQYWNGTGWINIPPQYDVTNEQGEAEFNFTYLGEDVPFSGECGQLDTFGNPWPCAVDGQWRVTVHFQESSFYQGEDLENTPLIRMDTTQPEGQASFLTAQVTVVLLIALSFALLIGAIMYRNYAERRRIEIIRGILTDSLMSLKASNDFIQTIFNCYKDLVRFFRKRGAMKKVYETTREFEDALNSMLGGIAPPEDLDEFFAIFEEARYSNHEIGAEQRDRAISTLQAIINHMTVSLGDSVLVRTIDNESSMYDTVTRAGEFIDSDGQVRLAGVDENDADSGFRI